MKFLFLILSFGLMSLSLEAQVDAGTEPVMDEKRLAKIQAKEEKKEEKQEQRETRRYQSGEGVAFTNEYMFGGGITAIGWYVSGTYATVSSNDKRRFYRLDILEYGDFKQKKQLSEYSLEKFGYDPPRRYIYGKQNNFYSIQLSSGVKDVIGEKAKKSGLEIQYQYGVGASLGLSKPYYLKTLYEIDDPPGFTLRDEKYVADSVGHFLEKTLIYGASPFTKGFAELGVTPGINLGGGLTFDWGAQRHIIRAIEVGLEADFYFKSPQIMANGNENPIFLNLYLGIQIGKRW